MNTLLDNLNTICNLDNSKLSTLGLPAFVLSQVNDARDVYTELKSGDCITSCPTLMIAHPELGLLVESVQTNNDNLITGFTTTTDIKKARKFPADWAKQNSKYFLDGKGVCYVTTDSKPAATNKATQIVGMFKMMITAGSLPEDLSPYINTSLWSGEDCRINTKLS